MFFPQISILFNLGKDFIGFWSKILFFFLNYEISFDFKLLFNLIRLGHVGDSLANANVLNNVFSIF